MGDFLLGIAVGVLVMAPIAFWIGAHLWSVLDFLLSCG